MHARARGVEISTYAYVDKPNQNRGQIKHYETEQIQILFTDASKGQNAFFIFNDSSKRPSSRRNSAECFKILQHRYMN